MTDLESSTVDELIDELYRRFPNLIVTGFREAPGEKEADQRILVFKGNILVTFSLASLARQSIRRRIGEIEEDCTDS